MTAPCLTLLDLPFGVYSLISQLDIGVYNAFYTLIAGKNY